MCDGSAEQTCTPMVIVRLPWCTCALLPLHSGACDRVCAYSTAQLLCARRPIAHRSPRRSPRVLARNMIRAHGLRECSCTINEAASKTHHFACTRERGIALKRWWTHALQRPPSLILHPSPAAARTQRPSDTVGTPPHADGERPSPGIKCASAAASRTTPRNLSRAPLSRARTSRARQQQQHAQHRHGRQFQSFCAWEDS